MERSAFLNNVRERLGRAAGPPPPPPRWEPPAELFYPDPGDRTAVYVAQSDAAGSKTEVVRNRVQARARARKLIEERGWSRVAADPKLRWPTLAAAWTHDGRDAEFGLCEADFALAETGTVVLLPGGERRRDTSLLPPVVGFFVPRSKILSRLTELTREMGSRGTDIPACVNLISGPSRTADIELDLCIGVHGPGEVYVWVIEDE